MNVSTQVFEKQYQSLRESLPVLEAKGATEDQLNVVRKAIAMSRDSFNAALLKDLRDDDSEIAALTQHMSEIQVTLDKAVKELGDVAEIIGVITKAVDIGSQLAAKAAAL